MVTRFRLTVLACPIVLTFGLILTGTYIRHRKGDVILNHHTARKIKSQSSTGAQELSLNLYLMWIGAKKMKV